MYRLLKKGVVQCVAGGFLFFGAAGAQQAPYEGPVQEPATGYAAAGPHSVSVATVKNLRRYRKKDIKVFYPDDIAAARPVIFFSHAFGANTPARYYETLENLASNGYVVVFTPYDSLATINSRYDQLWNGFTKAVLAEGGRMDLTRVGFAGHSFGAGATPEMAYRGYNGEGWGANGKMMFLMAPYYSFQISQQELQSLPSDMKLVVQIYEDDGVNDHRMAIDLFDTIPTANIDKDFSMIKTDTVSGYTFQGDHLLPNVSGQGSGQDGEYDGYDHWGVLRHLNALAAYTFDNDSAAGVVALGNGGALQTYMGETPGGTLLTPMEVTDNPSASQPQSNFTYQCSNTSNPRAQYCPN